MSTSACLINSTSAACLNSTKAALTTGGVVGTAVGGFFFLLLVIILIICCCCFCCKKSTPGNRGTVDYSASFKEEPSVIMISPQYKPPYTYNSNRPVPARQPNVNTISQNPSSARPASIRADSTRPASIRADSTRPASIRPDSTRPTSIRPDSTRPTSIRPDSTRPASIRPDSVRPSPVPSAPPPPTEEAYPAVDSKPVQEAPTYTFQYDPPNSQPDPQLSTVVENVENSRWD